MKSIKEVKEMSLEAVRAYRKSLNELEVEKDYLEKVEAILSIREAESVDLYEPMQEIETIELRGGARKGAGRPKTGVKRNKSFPAKLSEDELGIVNEIIDLAKSKEGTKNKTDTILKILEFYKDQR